jgi:tol-pal system protein YbgF
MRMNKVAIGVLLLFCSSAWAEAPVVDANESLTDRYALNETPEQQYVQGSNSTSKTQEPSSILLSKVTSLEQELQELRGKLEVQTHDLKLLNEQQQVFYKDLDVRLAKLAKNLGGTQASTEPKAEGGENTPITVSQPAKEKNAKDPSEIASAKLDTSSKSNSKPDIHSGDKLVNSGDGEQTYIAAYELIKRKQYNQAISGMEAFVTTYPESPYAANANYWLGEMHLMQGHVDQALRAFNTVVQRFPKSNKAPGALLKIGFAHYDKGEWIPAREALTKVKTLYPDTALAQLAADRLQTMDRQNLGAVNKASLPEELPSPQ